MERRVREGATQAHLLIVKSVGKKLASVLKDLAGPWTSCFFDPSREVVKLSKEAWQTSFTQPAKQVEALQFVANDIVRYCSRMLLEETPESLADPRFHTPDEIQSKYARATSCSLAALGYLLENVPSSAGEVDKMLNDKIWSFLIHQNPIIRRAAYNLLVKMSHHSPDLLKHHLLAISPQFPGKTFNDKDMSTHPDLWDAVLAVTLASPNIWTMGKKPTLPKLLAFLKVGGYGSVSATYPSLLPLMAHLPDEVILMESDGKLVFFQEFLDSVWKGLSLVDSKSGDVVLKSYLECLVYSLQRLAKMKSEAGKAASRDIHQQFLQAINAHLIPHLHSATRDKWTEAVAAQELGKSLVRLATLGAFDDVQQILTRLLIQDDSLSSENFEMLCHRAASLLLATRQAALESKDISTTQLVTSKVEEISELLSREILPRLTPESPHRFPALADFAAHIILAQPPVLTSLRPALDDFVERMPTFVSSKDISTGSIARTFDLVVADLEASSDQWPRVVSAIIPPRDAERSLELIANLLTKVDSKVDSLPPCDLLDNYIRDLAAYQIGQSSHQPHLETAISKALVGSPRFVSPETVEFCLARFTASLHQFVKDYLQVQEPLPHKLYAAGSWSARTIVDILNLMAPSPLDHENILVELWDLAHFSPRLDERRTLVELIGADNVLESLPHLAKECWAKMEKSSGLAKVIAARMVENLSIVSHVGLPEEYVEQVRQLMKLEGADSVLDTLMDENAWREAIKPFVNESSLLSLVGEGVLRPSPNVVRCKTTNVATDVNGYNSFTKRLLFTLGLMKLVGIDHWLFKKEHCWIINALVEAKCVLKDVAHGVSSPVSVDVDEVTQILDSIFAMVETFDLGMVVRKGISDGSCMQEALKMVSSRAMDEKHSARVLSHLALLLVESGSSLDARALIDMPDYVGLALCPAAKLGNVSALSTKLLQDPTWIHLAMYNECMDEVSSFAWLESTLEKQHVWMENEACLLLTKGARLLNQEQWRMVLPKLASWLETGHSDDGVVLLNHACQLVVAMPPEVSKKDLYSRLLGLLSLEADATEPLMQLQTSLAEAVMECPSNILQESTTLNDLVQTMSKSKNDSIQKACCVLLKRLVNDRVQVLSLKLEMRRKPDADSTPGTPIPDDRLEEKMLPSELLDICATVPTVHVGLLSDEANAEANAYLFAWMILLDHLDDAIFELKSAYLSHLRNANILPSLLEYVFEVLGVGKVKPFDLSQWDFVQFDVRGFDDTQSWSYCLLAAFLYWRVLRLMPSLTRLWFTDIRSRALSLAVETYTERFFTPLVIAAELDQVAKADKTLLDDKTQIKISRATGEIQAQYKVEETATLDLTIRFPNTFPLKSAEVDSLGSVKAGLREDRSRAWNLGVSSVMFAQNGSALDALTIWNRNVSLHYAGIEDCTIWYVFCLQANEVVIRLLVFWIGRYRTDNARLARTSSILVVCLNGSSHLAKVVVLYVVLSCKFVWPLKLFGSSEMGY